MKRSLLSIPVLTVLFTLAMWSGCVAAQPHVGWHPKSEQEMEQLIGNTVIKAVHQYHLQLQRQLNQHKPSGKLRLEPNPV